MRLSQFQFDLPPHLIAQSPCENRTDSRLLGLGRADGQIRDLGFQQFPAQLRKGDLLVMNDTRVIPARLFGKKETGGHVEIMLDRLVDNHRAWVQIRASKTPKRGSRIFVDETHCFVVLAKKDGLYNIECLGDTDLQQVLHMAGHMPLPPYISRPDSTEDKLRYQTVYGVNDGAVAAPTAGLHFDQNMLDEIQRSGIDIAYITLHVGAGTFSPVRTDNLFDHVMHSERVMVSAQLCEKVALTRQRGGRVIAVGTTTVRSLETAWQDGELRPYKGETEIFITPGYQFNAVDALLTNFHLSESTLIMLVCAFAGHEYIMNAYEHAIKKQYRFFSYGDAMFIS